MNMSDSTRKDSFEEAIDTLNSSASLFMLGFGVLAILIMQSLWETVSGLYFKYAYEAIVMPYTMYFVYKLYGATIGQKVNRAKVILMTIAFLMLFLPALYLLATNQVSFHEMIFSEFNPSLNHLSFAHYLPFVALAALFLPYKDFLAAE